MGNRVGTDWLPRRLPGISDRWNAWLRPLWLIVFGLTLLLDIAGTVYTLRDAYSNDPQFARIGLISEIENDGSVTIESQPRGDGKPIDLPPLSRIVAIDGTPVARDTRVWDLAAQLKRPDGAKIALTVLRPAGSEGERIERVERTYVADPANLIESGPSATIPRDWRVGIRLVFSLATCLTLMACAALLYWRRPRDPVAVLLSFSFLLYAGTIDPALVLWLAVGLGEAFDVWSTAGWVAMVIGLATFPDGRFVPRVLRWLLVIVPLASLLLAIDEVPILLAAVIAFVFPLGLLWPLVVKYRRFEPGIERQQLKWAAFGFAVGLVLLTIAFVIVGMMPESSQWQPLIGLFVLILFQGGFLAMAVGLLVSLIRFRLWEADVVITRSVAYAVVTVLIGIVWAASTDLVKEMVAAGLGQHNTTVSTSISAVIAAGLFAPTQSLVLGYTKRRFGKYSSKLKTTAERLPAWSATASPADLGMRTLAAIAESVHASRSAVLTLTPTGRELVAARGIEEPEALTAPETVPEQDPRFTLQLPLEDEDGPIGTLLLGPRSDGNRYNKDEREALQALTEPLAEAIRRAMARVQREAGVHKMISAVEERLARIEKGGIGGPAPA